MLVHVCDNCHIAIDGAMLSIDGFSISVDGEKKYQASDREFCSFGCMTSYYLNGIKGRGLEAHIKV